MVSNADCRQQIARYLHTAPYICNFLFRCDLIVVFHSDEYVVNSSSDPVPPYGFSLFKTK